MKEDTIENFKYPIGKPTIPQPITPHHITEWIQVLEEFPAQLKALVSDLTSEQLDTPYREGGWTLRQTIHHVADSHYNAYIRFKLALTEVKPIIKPYYEDRWAELHDSKKAPVSLSLNAIASLHAKWVYFLKSLRANELEHTFMHPESNKESSIASNIGLYAWHSLHHFAHIKNLMERRGW